MFSSIFFCTDTPPTEIYTLSLHDALPIFRVDDRPAPLFGLPHERRPPGRDHRQRRAGDHERRQRSEEHTSELQSRQYLVCRLLLEKKKKQIKQKHSQQTTKQQQYKQYTQN